MWHVRGSVEQLVYSMSAIRLHNAKAMLLNMLLDNVSDFAIPFARFNDVNGFAQCLVCDLNELLVLIRDVTNKESLIQIAVETSVIDGHVQVTDVPVLEWPRVWDAMTERRKLSFCLEIMEIFFSSSDLKSSKRKDFYQITSLTDVQHDFGNL